MDKERQQSCFGSYATIGHSARAENDCMTCPALEECSGDQAQWVGSRRWDFLPESKDRMPGWQIPVLDRKLTEERSENERLRAENERLRGHLQDIRDLGCGIWYDHRDLDMAAIAIAALGHGDDQRQKEE